MWQPLVAVDATICLSHVPVFIFLGYFYKDNQRAGGAAVLVGLLSGGQGYSQAKARENWHRQSGEEEAF